jgi:hypothetical protein
VAALTIATLTAMPAFAHHSFAVFFDDSRTVSVTGVVEEFQFRNPHGLIRLSVKKPGGGEETWKAETNSPSILERRGWNRTTLKVGETITIDGWPSRDGANYLRMRTVTRPDGKPVGSGLAPAESAAEQK